MAEDEGTRDEAAAWVADEVERLRGLSYEELARREGEADHHELRTSSGETLILETQVVWDPVSRQTLRVLVDVTRPGPVGEDSLAQDDFTRAPEGPPPDE